MVEHRVVSLIPSATEIVSALGCEDRLVGRSHECDFPPGVDRLTVCTEPRISVAGTSRQIDDRVKGALQEAVAIYRVFSDRLQRLQPTVVLTQTQCDVCAVSLADVEQAVGQLVGASPHVVPLEPNRLDDVWDDIRRVAAALDVPGRGTQLVETLQARLQALAERTAQFRRRPRVVCIEWIDPLMAAGNWVPELVEIAGGTPLLGDTGQHSPWMSWDDLLCADPDVIVVMPCGWDIPRIRREMPTLTDRPEWDRLQAVRNEKVYVTDGNQYFNRPGPRLVESAEILAEILHPTACDFGHRGTGWEHYANPEERGR